jgi:Divergent InlB B-repeat domain
MERVVVRDGWRRIVLALLFLSCVVFATPPSFAAQSVSLGWDPSPDANVAGYNVYYGPASRSYTNLLVAGNATSIIISGLVGGATYYFAATAYDVTGTESDYSNEVFYSVPTTNSASTNAPPFIIGLPNLSITANSATTNMPFVIGDPDTSVTKLTVWVVSSNPSLVPLSNIVISGTGSNRSCKVTPAPNQTGVAPIVVYVSDDTGNTVGDTFLLTVVAGAPLQPLVLLTNGSGTITPNLAAQTLTLGKAYSVTAKPAAGQLFSGWSGGMVSTSAKLTFTLVSNMVLQANFIPSPFIPASGTYNGLFYEDDGVKLNSAGFFTASLTAGGTYSGRVQLEGKTYSLSGKMNLQCQATNVIKRGTNLLTLVLRAGSGDQAGQIQGQFTDPNGTSSLQAIRAVYNTKTNPAPFAGNYTLVIPGQSGTPLFPSGHSFGTLRVSSNGVASFSGALADGAKISQGVTISQDSQWPLYSSLYSGKGLLLGTPVFANDTLSDFNGPLIWIKSPNPSARFYPAGFDQESYTLGSLYVAPTGTNAVAQLPDATLSFVGGNLSSNFVNVVSVGARSKITNLSSNKLSMSFVSGSGIYSGSVVDPGTGKTFSFGGAMLQKRNAGYGFLSGTNQASQVLLAP